MNRSILLKAIYAGFVRNERGVTLVEVLVAMAVSVLGLLGAITLYRAGHTTANIVRETTEMHHNVRRGLELMAEELQETDPETMDWDDDFIVCYSARNNGNFVVDAVGEPVWQHIVVYYYYPYDRALYRYTFDMNGDFETFESFITSVNDLTFERDDNLITLTMEMEADLESAGVSTEGTTTLETGMLLRN